MGWIAAYIYDKLKQDLSYFTFICKRTQPDFYYCLSFAKDAVLTSHFVGGRVDVSDKCGYLSVYKVGACLYSHSFVFLTLCVAVQGICISVSDLLNWF